METGDGKGLVVIDSIVDGTSSGGVRITEDITVDEVKALAREMSLKYSLFGLPRGGAKSGIRMSSGASAEEKRRLLRSFGGCIAPIVRAGIYYPGTDMNCSADDLKTIYKAAGVSLGRLTDTAYFTAISVDYAIRAWQGLVAAGKPLTVAVEGFGAVASHLFTRLPSDNYRITAISTIKGAAFNEKGFATERLLSLRNEFGDDMVTKIPDARKIEKKEVLTAPVDVLIPSARTWTIDEEVAPSVKARIVAPIANVPYTEEAAELLHAKGVISLPGFVTNAGGVFASSLFENGVNLANVETICATLYKAVVSDLLRKSKELGISPLKLAESVATRRTGARKDRSHDFYSRMARAGLANLPLLRKLRGGARARNIIDSLKTLSAEMSNYQEGTGAS